MTEDISRKTVAVLIVLSVILSVIGTWLALTMEPVLFVKEHTADEETTNVNLMVGYEEIPESSKETGKVKLQII